MFAKPSSTPTSFLLLFVAGMSASTLLCAQSADETGKDKKAVSRPAPTLLGISREIANLRRSAKYLVLLRVKKDDRFEYFRGVHLGNGLVATPYVAGTEAGRPATLSFAANNYRVLALGSNKNFASYWKLRDSAYHEALPSPRYFSEQKGRAPGPMVLIVSGQRSRLSLLDADCSKPGFGRLSGGSKAKAAAEGAGKHGRPKWGNVFAYYLEDRYSDVGSAVLAMDASFMGLLLRPVKRIPSVPKRAARGQRVSKADTRKQQERQRRIDSFAMVLDGKLLQNRAAEMAKSASLAGVPPSLGVRFPFFHASGKQPSLRRAYLATNVLVVVSKGGPADRAGAKPGDVWRAVNGKALTGPSQLRLTLEGLAASQVLNVRFDRGDKKGLTLQIKPD